MRWGVQTLSEPESCHGVESCRKLAEVEVIDDGRILGSVDESFAVLGRAMGQLTRSENKELFVI